MFFHFLLDRRTGFLSLLLTVDEVFTFLSLLGSEMVGSTDERVLPVLVSLVCVGLCQCQCPCCQCQSLSLGAGVGVVSVGLSCQNRMVELVVGIGC